MEKFDCDICGKTTYVKDRWAARIPRPSTGELTEVLWGCKDCGPAHHMEDMSQVETPEKN